MPARRGCGNGEQARPGQGGAFPPCLPLAPPRPSLRWSTHAHRAQALAEIFQSGQAPLRLDPLCLAAPRGCSYPLGGAAGLWRCTAHRGPRDHGVAVVAALLARPGNLGRYWRCFVARGRRVAFPARPVPGPAPASPSPRNAAHPWRPRLPGGRARTREPGRRGPRAAPRRLAPPRACRQSR